MDTLFGEHCYRNCIGFLRINVYDLKNKHPTGDYEILDITRVHPEDYNYAWKMAKDALEKEDVDSHVEELMRAPTALESLDIDMFAELLEKKLDSKKHNTLYDIKAELYKPFDDPREIYKDLDPEQVFDLLTATNDDTFARGMLVKVRVLNFLPMDTRPIPVLLEANDLKGFITRANVSDDYGNTNSLQPGDTVMARVLKIEKPEFRCFLSTKESDLRDKSFEPRRPSDTHLIEDLEEEARELERASAAAARKTRQIYERAIRHPLFKNLDASSAEAHLSVQPAGSIVIRPSSSGYNHLAITWKFYDDGTRVSYVHITIREEDKPNNLTLGRKLVIESERYDDLNEVVVRFIDPMVELASSVVEHRRFKAGTRPEIEQFLMNAKIQNPSEIPYVIGVSFDQPPAARFVLYHHTGSKVVADYMTVTPTGLRYFGKKHTSVQNAINYFKRHYKERRDR